ncbi:hypothetical protein LPL18_015475 [Halomonas sp. CUBES01]|uniref:BON domain-containing protein n=1 Tax=Vreelandella gomseomensis TaxID=370766 RepID=A0ABU1GFB4_9GAMM|nr:MULTISPECIES: hypothetical protein [Halomonas]MDR5875734.1 hypothetical protein [Halomonas gomseomensis]MEC4768729.1 hypothetical protein [Halomonas sp. CUBES01]
MKLKTTLSALVIAAVPMAAQAGQASERTMELNEPLQTAGQVTHQDAGTSVSVMDVSQGIVSEGDSTAMAKARANLQANYQHETDIELSADELAPAREATT